jgi:hypothetical protein
MHLSLHLFVINNKSHLKKISKITLYTLDTFTEDKLGFYQNAVYHSGVKIFYNFPSEIKNIS